MIDEQAWRREELLNWVIKTIRREEFPLGEQTVADRVWVLEAQVAKLQAVLRWAAATDEGILLDSGFDLTDPDFGLLGDEP